MSTKTTLKRIALVAVSALGFGLVTAVAPASAAIVYSSSATTGTYGKAGSNDGALTSFIITATGDAAGDTTATIYWTKTAGRANDTISAQLTSALSSAGTTVSTQATGGSADTGTITWTAPGVGTSQVRVNYKAHTTAEGTITFCYAMNTAGTACADTAVLTTLTESTSTTAVGAGTRAPWMVNIPSANASTTYVSASTINVSQVASAGGYVELKAQYEDIDRDTTAPNISLITVDGGTFHSAISGGTYTNYNGATASSSTSATLPAHADTLAGDLVRIATPTVGTITVKYITRAVDANGISTDTTRQTITINVTTAPTVYSYSTSEMTANNAGFVAGDDVLYAPSAASTQVATVTVKQYSALNSLVAAASSQSVTATLTGAGSLASATGGAVTSLVAYPATSGNTLTVSIFGSGTAGTGTLTIAVGGVTLKTHTLKFYGTAAKVEVSTNYAIGREGGYVQGTLDSAANAAGKVSEGGLVPFGAGGTKTAGADNDPAIAVLVTDANGTPVPSTVSVSSSNPNVVLPLTASNVFIDSGEGIYAAGTWYRHYTYETASMSVSGQSSTLTFSVALSNGTTVSGSTKISIGGAPATETLSLDKATYAPGEAMVVTRKAVDSAGNPVYDNAVANAVSFNKAVGGSLGATVYLGGTAYTTQATRPTVFAPATTGAFEARMTGKKAGATSAIVATATVTDDAATAAANAASDAAAEAIDAANAATDAANLAAEAADAATVAAEEARDAADAATAAVEELATQVATLMAALKAQITTLANTVAKIAKKVKA